MAHADAGGGIGEQVAIRPDGLEELLRELAGPLRLTVRCFLSAQRLDSLEDLAALHADDLTAAFVAAPADFTLGHRAAVRRLCAAAAGPPGGARAAACEVWKQPMYNLFWQGRAVAAPEPWRVQQALAARRFALGAPAEVARPPPRWAARSPACGKPALAAGPRWAVAADGLEHAGEGGAAVPGALLPQALHGLRLDAAAGVAPRGHRHGPAAERRLRELDGAGLTRAPGRRP
eukprot:CAMPEP_0168429408 /NCGR_PEP_ID=MMETSP0228-20121227/37354_1 /TAXON_ID=133427 /ORGANISM="Protoceratium reticulatum, Strain CCCM 535 (=CCMP 1889)" /LENGTH=232 /DNA_ID=CAMNT_0008443491 /DNA_START=1 /DNA_END=696 /DNA_ORIENTATION=-